jgi:hypothetical protein
MIPAYIRAPFSPLSAGIGNGLLPNQPLPRVRIIRALPVMGASAESNGFQPGDLRSISGSAMRRSAAGPWKPPTSAELREEIGREPVFARAFKRVGDTESDRWLGELSDAMRRHGAALPDGDKGFVMILRFPAAYRSVGHMAIGSAWRNDAGRLKVAFLHQESLPDVGPDGARKASFSGDFFRGFDTRARHADGIAPVEESMKLAGLPDVNVSPCREPQSLPQVTTGLSRAVGNHVYGMSPTWPGVAEGLAEGRPYFANCFMVSHLADQALRGGRLFFPLDHDTSTSIRALESMSSTDLLLRGTIGSGDGARTIEQVFRDDPPRKQISAAEGLGVAWGNDRPWDVSSSSRVESKALVVGAGPLTLPPEIAPGWQSLKFSVEPKGLTITDAAGGERQSVKAGVAYTRQECERMQMADSAKLRFDVSWPIDR